MAASEQNSAPQTSKNVCIIGAGPSGIVVARELRKEGHNVVVLEQNHDIGGQWLYEQNVEGENPLGGWNSPSFGSQFRMVHSSIYASLRIMNAREIMGYTDFPFLMKEGQDTRRFPRHREVFLCLRDFCEWFGIRPLIRFNTRVEYVGMLDDGEDIEGKDLRWVVKSREKSEFGEKVVEEVFDAAVVANGHYSKPRMPSIKGKTTPQDNMRMDTWRRKQMHGHVYRVPDPFRDEVVVVVGSSFSGQDIAMELVNVAKKVYLSAKSPDNILEGLSKVISKHNNLHLRPQIDSLGEDGGVTFVDGSRVIAQTIIYCTGYSYSFPFLDTKGIVSIDDDRVGPLFEHTFPPSLAPSLSFVGIPRRLLGFPESQGKWIAKLLAGKRALPPLSKMMESIQEFYDCLVAAGIPKHETHALIDMLRYADYCVFPHQEEWRKSICRSTIEQGSADVENYRESWEGDKELIHEALQSPHFTQLGPLDFPLKTYGITSDQ